LDDFNDSEKINIIINDNIFDYELYANIEYEGKHFYGLQTKIVDIDKSDYNKEIWISQLNDQWGDAGKENTFILKINNELIKKTLSSRYYNAGKITFLEDAKFKLQVSYCPFHTQTYQLRENDLKLINEEIGEIPPEGCPACFVPDKDRRFRFDL